MYPKILTFQLVQVIPTILMILSYEKSNANAGIFGLGIFSNAKPYSAEPQNFFEQISKVPISILDIEAMYANVSSTANTNNCPVCRTPVAIWVLNSLFPCHDITKKDCPTGLVCCHSLSDTFLVNSLKRSDAQVDGDYEWNEDKFDPGTFRQDPLPGDNP